jgi:hypothetical protein
MMCVCGAHFLRELVVNATGEMAPATGIVGAHVASKYAAPALPPGSCSNPIPTKFPCAFRLVQSWIRFACWSVEFWRPACRWRGAKGLAPFDRPQRLEHSCVDSVRTGRPRRPGHPVQQRDGR